MIKKLNGSNSRHKYAFLAFCKFDLGQFTRIGIIVFLMICFNTQSILAQSPPPKIHPADLQNSNDFKSNIGGNRYLIFIKLQNLIKPVSSFEGPAPAYDYYIGDYKVSATDLVFLLGEPDVKIAPAVWQYNLSANQQCKVIIGIDEDGMVSYMVNKGCL